MFLITILVILLIEQPRVYQSEVDMNHHKISWERALVSGLTDVFLIKRNVFNNHGFRVLQKFWVPSTGSHSNHHLGWLNQQLCSWKIIMAKPRSHHHWGCWNVDLCCLKPWGKPGTTWSPETSACEKAKCWRSALELATWKVVEVEMWVWVNTY